MKEFEAMLGATSELQKSKLEIATICIELEKLGHSSFFTNLQQMPAIKQRLRSRERYTGELRRYRPVPESGTVVACSKCYLIV
jgi:hypothetical protein